MASLKIHTIGFTNKSAEKFFSLIQRAEVKKVIDVRLNTTSQLSGFAKKNDLKYFLNEICSSSYYHKLELAPTKQILDAYKKHKGSWEVYEQEFLELMDKRNISQIIDRNLIHESCLLCSEDKPHKCHRRLVAEYLSKRWDQSLQIIHLY